MKNIITAILICIHCLPFTLQAATNFELGAQAYAEKSYSNARSFWVLGAQEGDANCSYNLGVLLATGLGGEKDVKASVPLFHYAARKNIPEAQHNLALAYFKGNGIKQNADLARQWWEKAALNGHSQAQYNLSVLLWRARGKTNITQEKQALNWMRLAAKSGNAKAKVFIDTLPNKPSLPSTLHAKKKNELRSISGETKIPTSAELAYKNGDYKTALAIWNQDTINGDIHAEYRLALLYLNGQGTNQNIQRAITYLTHSATMGDANAQYQLAKHLIDNKSNTTLGLYWMQTAADNKHKLATSYLSQR